MQGLTQKWCKVRKSESASTQTEAPRSPSGGGRLECSETEVSRLSRIGIMAYSPCLCNHTHSLGRSGNQPVFVSGGLGVQSCVAPTRGEELSQGVCRVEGSAMMLPGMSPAAAPSRWFLTSLMPRL